MKISRILGNLLRKTRSILPCDLRPCTIATSSHSATTVNRFSSDSHQSLDNDAQPLEDNAQSEATASTIPPSTPFHRPHPPTLIPSHRSTASFSRNTTHPNALLAPPPNDPFHQMGLPPPTSLPTITEEPHPSPTTTLPTADLTALHAEIANLRTIYHHQQTEILALSTDLEREHLIAHALQHSKLARPRKLKRQIALLTAQAHAKDAEIAEWRVKFANLACVAGVRGEIARTTDLLEHAVRELEVRGEEWRGRVEEVGRLARQVERRGRGLGMWWTREEGEELGGLVGGG